MSHSEKLRTNKKILGDSDFFDVGLLVGARSQIKKEVCWGRLKPVWKGMAWCQKCGELEQRVHLGNWVKVWLQKQVNQILNKFNPANFIPYVWLWVT